MRESNSEKRGAQSGRKTTTPTKTGLVPVKSLQNELDDFQEHENQKQIKRMSCDSLPMLVEKKVKDNVEKWKDYDVGVSIFSS